jgi:hypothetical protein
VIVVHVRNHNGHNVLQIVHRFGVKAGVDNQAFIAFDKF